LLGTPNDPNRLPGYFGTQVDKDVLGVAHMYKGEGVAFDPEGITSTMTSIVQVIFGYFVGLYIQQKGKSYEMLTNLFIAGSILIFTGFMWDLVFPINKKIWTSSYVLYTTGLAIMVLGVLIHLIEMKKANEQAGWSKLFRFFDAFGKNALFIFFMSGFLPRIVSLLRWVDHVDENGKKSYTNAFGWFYHEICAPLFSDPRAGSLLYAICTVLFYWAMAYWMDKRKIYIKV
jgi:predicted acyltransferase